MNVGLVHGVAPAVITDLFLDLVPDDRCWGGGGSGGWWWGWGSGFVNWRGGWGTAATTIGAVADDGVEATVASGVSSVPVQDAQSHDKTLNVRKGNFKFKKDKPIVLLVPEI